MKEELSDEEFLKKLKAAAPFLAKMPSQPEPLSAERLREFESRLSAISPMRHTLSSEQMNAAVLNILAREAAAGATIISLLRKANLHLKDAGEAGIYALLDLLETRALVASDLVEAESRMVKRYRVTEQGRAQVQRVNEKSKDVQTWLAVIFKPA